MLFFLDESGSAKGGPPYYVLGGVAVDERQLWPYVQAIRQLELATFGMRLRDLASPLPGASRELKGRQLLQRDKFRFAGQGPPLGVAERRDLARSFLHKGLSREAPRRDEFRAYGQAVLDFVAQALATAATFGVKVFASIVEPKAPRQTDQQMLRRDHAFLFQRFYQYLEETASDSHGLLVFDELERSQCLGVIRRMEGYFLRTKTGRMLSKRIIPEPFFVHSDLTTAVQMADVVCYVLNWTYRYGRMSAPIRAELNPYLDLIMPLVYKRPPSEQSSGYPVYSVFYVDDLRPRGERGA